MAGFDSSSSLMMLGMTYIDVIYFLTGMIKSRLIVGVGGVLAKVGSIKNLAGGGVSGLPGLRIF